MKIKLGACELSKVYSFNQCQKDKRYCFFITRITKRNIYIQWCDGIEGLFYQDYDEYCYFIRDITELEKALL